jgi:hypothetical protein
VVLKAWSAFSIKASHIRQDQTKAGVKIYHSTPGTELHDHPPIKHRPDRVKFIAKERGRREFAGIGW